MNWNRDLDQFGIGLIKRGAFIIRDCHLPALRIQAGFRVVGISSRTPGRAAEVAGARGVPRVYRDHHELLADPEIQVVDIGVPPQYQPAIIRDVIRHADHVRGILAQKPLAMSLSEAREIVELCEAAGITLAVNQNMRHDQSVRACKDILNRGWLGTAVLGTIDMRAIPHWMPWSRDLHSLSTYIMSIHHLDCFRYWFGEPERVMASTRPDPRTTFPHSDGINLYILEFSSGCRASSWDDVWTGPVREGEPRETSASTKRVEGTDGPGRGEPSAGLRTRLHTPSTLDYTTKARGDSWFQPRWPEAWFPEAFRGTMGELLLSLKHAMPPPISGRDNLKTPGPGGSRLSPRRGEHCVVELK